MPNTYYSAHSERIQAARSRLTAKMSGGEQSLYHHQELYTVRSIVLCTPSMGVI
ncbi:hypothetical protein AVDCRST_MAG94-965 [uncultured Leptolyngbya sp.]|uniref:Uncharacterized protein n=1 Tax=uncultured Leptolyngbya sp. TaxID=332963 RepID=A0A6J4KNX7_9CYAN|nr:hypothetical protein AVDCRST_MAG94-965 [uncultured Leptolyngbya sp.]